MGLFPASVREDAHDILETYRVVAKGEQMARTPRNFDDFIASLKQRHAKIMAMRPGKMPGQFKEIVNRAGSTHFVLPSLVQGTLAKGFEIYQGIEQPLHRAIYMMFLVSEVHPFADGNGRVGRVMMNSELVAAGEQKIIVPTVYRNNYITSLKALSQTGRTSPFVRVLDFAQRYTSSIPWEEFDQSRAALQATHAFLDANEAENRGLYLVLHGNAGE